MSQKTRQTTMAALSNDDNGISVSQTPAATGAQNLTITGALATAGVATMAAAQIVSIESAGNDSGRTFTVYGTDADGNTISEAVTGANVGTAVTTKYFKTVTRISTDDDTAGAVYAGPVGADGAVSASVEVNVNEYGSDYKSLYEVDLAGSGTYSLQGTWDDFNATYTEGPSEDANWIDITGFTGKTASFALEAPLPVRMVRVKQTTGNTTGAVKLTVVNRLPPQED